MKISLGEGATQLTQIAGGGGRCENDSELSLATEIFPASEIVAQKPLSILALNWEGWTAEANL